MPWNAIFEDLVGRYGEGRLSPATKSRQPMSVATCTAAFLLPRLDSELSRAFPV